MVKKFYTSIRFTATISLVLVFALSAVWATTYYKSKVIDEGGGSIPIHADAKLEIPNGALSAYLDEQGVDSVELTIELVEIYDGAGNLDRLEFTFSPSNAEFDPPVELRLKGDYLDPTKILVDENGEALEYTTQGSGNSVTFYLPHFSSYSYDDYEY